MTMTLERIARLRNLQTAVRKLETLPSTPANWLDRLRKRLLLHRERIQLEQRLISSIAAMTKAERQALDAVFRDGCRSKNSGKCYCGSCQRRRQMRTKGPKTRL